MFGDTNQNPWGSPFAPNSSPDQNVNQLNARALGYLTPANSVVDAMADALRLPSPPPQNYSAFSNQPQFNPTSSAPVPKFTSTAFRPTFAGGSASGSSNGNSSRRAQTTAEPAYASTPPQYSLIDRAAAADYLREMQRIEASYRERSAASEVEYQQKTSLIGKIGWSVGLGAALFVGLNIAAKHISAIEPFVSSLNAGMGLIYVGANSLYTNVKNRLVPTQSLDTAQPSRNKNAGADFGTSKPAKKSVRTHDAQATPYAPVTNPAPNETAANPVSIPIRVAAGAFVTTKTVVDPRDKQNRLQSYTITPPGAPTNTVLGDTDTFTTCGASFINSGKGHSRTVLSGGNCLGHTFSTVNVPLRREPRCEVHYPDTKRIMVLNCGVDGTPVRSITFTRQGFPNSPTKVLMALRNG